VGHGILGWNVERSRPLLPRSGCWLGLEPAEGVGSERALHARRTKLAGLLGLLAPTFLAGRLAVIFGVKAGRQALCSPGQVCVLWTFFTLVMGTACSVARSTDPVGSRNLGYILMLLAGGSRTINSAFVWPGGYWVVGHFSALVLMDMFSQGVVFGQISSLVLLVMSAPPVTVSALLWFHGWTAENASTAYLVEIAGEWVTWMFSCGLIVCWGPGCRRSRNNMVPARLHTTCSMSADCMDGGGCSRDALLGTPHDNLEVQSLTSLQSVAPLEPAPHIRTIEADQPAVTDLENVDGKQRKNGTADGELEFGCAEKATGGSVPTEIPPELVENDMQGRISTDALPMVIASCSHGFAPHASGDDVVHSLLEEADEQEPGHACSCGSYFLPEAAFCHMCGARKVAECIVDLHAASADSLEIPRSSQAITFEEVDSDAASVGSSVSSHATMLSDFTDFLLRTNFGAHSERQKRQELTRSMWNACLLFHDTCDSGLDAIPEEVFHKTAQCFDPRFNSRSLFDRFKRIIVGRPQATSALVATGALAPDEMRDGTETSAECPLDGCATISCRPTVSMLGQELTRSMWNACLLFHSRCDAGLIALQYEAFHSIAQCFDTRFQSRSLFNLFKHALVDRPRAMRPMAASALVADVPRGGTEDTAEVLPNA